MNGARRGRDTVGITRARAGLAAARVLFGATALVAPRLLQRACLLEPREDASTTAAWRYFGARAIALGTGWVLADEEQRVVLDRVGLLVDATDTAFLSAMVAAGSMPPLPAAMMGSTTVAATAVGVLAARDRTAPASGPASAR